MRVQQALLRLVQCFQSSLGACLRFHRITVFGLEDTFSVSCQWYEQRLVALALKLFATKGVVRINDDFRLVDRLVRIEHHVARNAARIVIIATDIKDARSREFLDRFADLDMVDPLTLAMRTRAGKLVDSTKRRLVIRARSKARYRNQLDQLHRASSAPSSRAM